MSCDGTRDRPVVVRYHGAEQLTDEQRVPARPGPDESDQAPVRLGSRAAYQRRDVAIIERGQVSHKGRPTYLLDRFVELARAGLSSAQRGDDEQGSVDDRRTEVGQEERRCHVGLLEVFGDVEPRSFNDLSAHLVAKGHEPFESWRADCLISWLDGFDGDQGAAGPEGRSALIGDARSPGHLELSPRLRARTRATLVSPIPASPPRRTIEPRSPLVTAAAELADELRRDRPKPLRTIAPLGRRLLLGRPCLHSAFNRDLSAAGAPVRAWRGGRRQALVALTSGLKWTASDRASVGRQFAGAIAAASMPICASMWPSES